MIVYKVEAKHIEAVFPYIEHLLLKPLSRGVGEVTIEHVKEYCKAEQQQLWLGLNKDSKNKKSLQLNKYETGYQKGVSLFIY